MIHDDTRPVHTLVLIGPHGAGKTTLAWRIGRRLGWRIDDEIGARRRAEAQRLDEDAHALASGSDFDRAVCDAELARDLAAMGPRVVETWHVGNLAYARERNPALASELDPRLRCAVEMVTTRGRLLVQPLVIDRPTAVARRSERGPDALIDFFLAVGRRAEQIARGWGVAIAPPIRTDRCSIEAAETMIMRRVGANAAQADARGAS